MALFPLRARRALTRELNPRGRVNLRSLKALEKFAALRPEEIRRFADLASEARAATNTHLLDALSASESAGAGRLSQRRRRREQKDEQG